MWIELWKPYLQRKRLPCLINADDVIMTQMPVGIV